ncbi:hypothetical protein WJX84_005003 [Apatococcus fuscideae]|uniref:RING-type domain-containing protein n=1 Tax=Apatococcus fuscideae TaxID=2026836 RepID=A0AAW1TIG0_9CHLO
MGSETCYLDSDCPVCLRPTPEVQAAYLLPACWHRFCTECISKWTAVQQQHPGPATAPSYSCPLCKANYDSYVWGSQSDQTFQQTSVDPQHQFQAPPTILSPEVRARRAFYYSRDPPCHSTQDRRSVQLQARAWDADFLQRGDVVTFAARELRALLLEANVDLLVLHVQGILDANARQRGSQDGAAWRHAVSAGMQKFLPEHAAQFAAELWAFFVSGKSLTAYDLACSKAMHRAQLDTALPADVLALRAGSETTGSQSLAIGSGAACMGGNGEEPSVLEHPELGRASEEDQVITITDEDSDLHSGISAESGPAGSDDYDFLAHLPPKRLRREEHAPGGIAQTCHQSFEHAPGGTAQTCHPDEGIDAAESRQHVSADPAHVSH